VADVHTETTSFPPLFRQKHFESCY